MLNDEGFRMLEMITQERNRQWIVKMTNLFKKRIYSSDSRIVGAFEYFAFKYILDLTHITDILNLVNSFGYIKLRKLKEYTDEETYGLRTVEVMVHITDLKFSTKIFRYIFSSHWVLVNARLNRIFFLNYSNKRLVLSKFGSVWERVHDVHVVSAHETSIRNIYSKYLTSIGLWISNLYGERKSEVKNIYYMGSDMVDFVETVATKILRVLNANEIKYRINDFIYTMMLSEGMFYEFQPYIEFEIFGKWLPLVIGPVLPKMDIMEIMSCTNVPFREITKYTITEADIEMVDDKMWDTNYCVFVNSIKGLVFTRYRNQVLVDLSRLASKLWFIEGEEIDIEYDSELTQNSLSNCIKTRNVVRSSTFFIKMIDKIPKGAMRLTVSEVLSGVYFILGDYGDIDTLYKKYQWICDTIRMDLKDYCNGTYDWQEIGVQLQRPGMDVYVQIMYRIFDSFIFINREGYMKKYNLLTGKQFNRGFNDGTLTVNDKYRHAPRDWPIIQIFDVSVLNVVQEACNNMTKRDPDLDFYLCYRSSVVCYYET